MSTCSSSFSLGSGFMSRRVEVRPSLTLPLPRSAILAPVSRSMRFCVLPRGPIMSPMKL